MESPNSEFDRQLETATAAKYWDSKNFKQILLLTAISGKSVPGVNRPDGIHIQFLREFVDDLKGRSERDPEQNEYATVIFADFSETSRPKIKRGKITKGKIKPSGQKFVRLDHTKEKGREKSQIPVANIHIHPSKQISLGYSKRDYATFMGLNEQVMVIAHTNNDNVFVILKTSATPESFSSKHLSRIIDETEKDFLRSNSDKSFVIKLMEFNKMICSQLGLVMLLATKETRDQTNRMEVTKL